MNEPEQQNSANLVGRTIAGRYTIRGTVGAGGMGFVYRAVQAAPKREVALKVLRADLAHQEGIAERFSREAEAAGGINHPNAITIYESGEDNGIFYLAMELLIGETLRQRLRQETPLEVDHALDIFEAMAGALAAAHRVGVIHRDLKPDNIFLAQFEGLGEVVKVLDFGLAKLLDRPPGDEGLVTDVNLRLGTPRYMAPEQALGLQPIDARCDLYALGLLLFEMLAHRAPFVSEDGMEVLAQRLRKEAPRLSQVVPARNFTPEIDDFVAALLVRDREKRPNDANKVVQRLRELRRANLVCVVPQPVASQVLPSLYGDDTVLPPPPLRQRVASSVGQPLARPQVSSVPSLPAQPAYRPQTGQGMPLPLPKVTTGGPALVQSQIMVQPAPSALDDFDKPTVVMGGAAQMETLARSSAGQPIADYGQRSAVYPMGLPVAGGSRILASESMPGRGGLFQTPRARRMVVVLLTAAAGAPLLALLYRECRPREAPPLVDVSGGETRGVTPPPRLMGQPQPVVTAVPQRPAPLVAPSQPLDGGKSARARTCPVKLLSTPAGAQLSRDGTVIGATPYIDNLPCGSPLVHYQARSQGYLPYDLSYTPPGAPASHRPKLMMTLIRRAPAGKAPGYIGP